ncbi:MAG: uncharacterized protein QOF12_43 [Solirubrobacteraceae bacterium]|nr:uncharacterized protein [Solirubrobacteraceae bacterium]
MRLPSIRLVDARVASLHRWPVKSLGGEPVDRLAIDERGGAGDRAHALFDVFKDRPRRLTVRQVPRMLRWSAGYGAVEVPLGNPPPPTVTGPDGRSYGWDDIKLPGVLAEDLGRPVTLRRDLALMQDLPDSLLVTFGASHRAVEAALGPLDPLRWRTNIHVEADAEPFAELGWEGLELRVGTARLALLHPCERCVIPTRDPATAERRPDLLRWLHAEHATMFGINARALAPARIAVGDPVELYAA